MICRHHTKWTSAALQPFSGTFLKDSGEGKSSQWAELRAVPLVRCGLYTDLWPVAWVVREGLGRNIIGKLMTRKSGEDVSKMSKNMKIPVSHISAHQRVTSTKEDLNNQVDRVTYSVNTSEPLSPAAQSPPNGIMNRVAIVAWWGYARAQERGLLLTTANSAAAPAEHPVCQQQRPARRPWHGTMPQGHRPATHWQTDYTGPLPSGKGHCFVPTGIDTCSGGSGFTKPSQPLSQFLKTLPFSISPERESYVMSSSK